MPSPCILNNVNQFIDIYTNIAQHIETAFIDRKFIEKSWSKLDSQYQEKVKKLSTEAAFHKAMNDLMSQLPLSHCEFITPQLALEREHLQSGSKPADSMQITNHDTSKYIYVKVPSFIIPPFSFDTLKAIFLGLIGDRRPVILDLRLNSGGAISAVGETLNVLIGANSPFIITKQAQWENESKPEVIYPQPERANRGSRLDVQLCNKYAYIQWRTSKKQEFLLKQKVIILSDKRNHSCGEVFVQALKDKERAIVVGQTSAGAVVGARDNFDCGEGYRLSLPFVTMETPEEYQLEGQGVKPDVEYKFKTPDTESLSDEEALKVLELAQKAEEKKAEAQKE